MSTLVIEGGKRVEGRVDVEGNKMRPCRCWRRAC
jgi:UDP-N-acetylglucosamine enolpyruvyl transferase